MLKLRKGGQRLQRIPLAMYESCPRKVLQCSVQMCVMDDGLQNPRSVAPAAILPLQVFQDHLQIVISLPITLGVRLSGSPMIVLEERDARWHAQHPKIEALLEQRNVRVDQIRAHLM